MSRRLVWISDTHLDLTTDSIDRNEEIESVIMFAVRHAVKIHAHYFVFGGDVFDGNPSDEAVSVLIRALNVLCEAGIIVWVMDGNHEKKSRGKASYLHFVQDLKPYKNLFWVHDIKTVKVFKGTYFSFFPHVNKATIPEPFRVPQDYVEHRAEKIIKKFDFFWQHFVFSHLNVRGVIPGTEEHMLKKSEVYLPDQFHTKSYIDKPFPTVLNGHIHSASKSGWVNIIGSPIFVSFGEKDKEKYFAVVDIPTKRDESPAVHLIPTPCRKFHEISVEVKSGEVFDVDARINSAFQHVGKRDYVKIDVVAQEGFAFDWEGLRKKLMEQCHYVMPIKPRFVKRRVKRNVKQKLNLNPVDAVNVFVKANKPKLSKAVVSVAKRYIDGMTV